MAVVSSQTTLAAGAAAVQIVGVDTDRQSGQRVVIRNADAANSLYLGPAGVTASTGHLLPAATAVASVIELDPGEVLYAFSTLGAVVTVLRLGA